jgi:Putative ER transporter, 6TM, N-terminal
VYCIFTIVASTYAPVFPNMTAGRSFAKRLIETFLTGFGIATGVSLFIFPMTSRTIVCKQMGGFVGLLKLALSAHGKYMRSISLNHGDDEKESAPTPEGKNEMVDNGQQRPQHGLHGAKNQKKKVSSSALPAEAAVMKKALIEVGALFGKIHMELGFAKKEMAYGKLGCEDLANISLHLRDIMLPVVGMTTFIDILASVKDKGTSAQTLLESADTVEAVRKLEIEEWDEIMAFSHEPFQRLNESMQEGLTHISYVLELAKRPKKGAKDIEKASKHPEPGEKGFVTYLENEMRDFGKHRESTLKSWCERKGIDLPTAFWDDPTQYYSMEDEKAAGLLRQKENQQQLYLVLYVEYLTWSIGQSILKMVRYADGKVADGTMSKKRIILPGWKRIVKWIRRVFDPDDTDSTDDIEIGSANIWVGDSLKARKDPEHLPPTTLMQKTTGGFRAIPRFLGSSASA